LNEKTLMSDLHKINKIGQPLIKIFLNDGTTNVPKVFSVSYFIYVWIFAR